jgi:predicted DNA-binding transcriptional regulator AlpA
VHGHKERLCHETACASPLGYVPGSDQRACACVRAHLGACVCVRVGATATPPMNLARIYHCTQPTLLRMTSAFPTFPTVYNHKGRDMDERLTIEGVASLARCSSKSIRLWMKSDENPFPGPVAFGHPRQWDRAEVVAWLGSHRAWVLQPRGE